MELKLAWGDCVQGVRVGLPAVEVFLSEGGFESSVVSAGHGVQRAYLLALLEELSRSSTETMSTLILAIEEPELYQHPPQARHMAEILQSLSRENTEVLVSTHSPYFVTSRGFEGIRLVRRPPSTRVSTVASLGAQEIANRLAHALDEEPRSPAEVMASAEQILQVRQNEVFFASIPVLVEGAEDEALILTHLRVTGMLDEFRSLGCHVVPVEGKTNMSRPLVAASGLGISVFVVFDGDSDCRQESRQQNTKTNSCLLKLCGAQAQGSVDGEACYGPNFVMWGRTIAAAVEDSLMPGVWKAAQDAVRSEQRLEVGIKAKNPVLISATLGELARRGEYSSELEDVCRRILEFAREPGPRDTSRAAAAAT